VITKSLTVPTGTISEKFISRVTVLEFVSQYVGLKPTRRGAPGLCPFHDNHHPSFGVNEAGNYWHCFAGCGGGSVIDLWTKLRGCDFTTAVRELAEMLL
jgi:DNA primase